MSPTSIIAATSGSWSGWHGKRPKTRTALTRADGREGVGIFRQWKGGMVERQRSAYAGHFRSLLKRRELYSLLTMS